MVGTVEARKLNLSLSSRSSKVITSLLYEPISLSLALVHSDASFSLISPFSPFSNSSISPQTLIPPFSSSACFVPLCSNPKIQDCPDDKNVVFVTAGSHNGGSKVVLKFYVLGKGGKFGGAQVGCSQNGVCFDRRLGGVVVDVSHGMKVMLSGSVNYFALYSASSAKVLVFGVRLVGEGRRELRLVKCAVIECQLPVLTICVSSWFLILGELKGVRVFPLRALVKGKVGSRRKSRVARGKVENSNSQQQPQQEVDGNKLEGRKLKMPNGLIKPLNERIDLDKNVTGMNSSKLLANGFVHNVLDGGHSNANVDDSHHGTVKPRSLKLRQDSGECGMQFVCFNGSIDEGTKSMPGYMTIKAISIQAVSAQKFLILDSNGDLHVLYVLKSASVQMRHVPGTIQVQQLAAFPDTSANYRVWVTDGLNSMHVLMLSSPDTPENENSSNNEEMITCCSVNQAIFTSENIQDMIAVAANTVLLLGKDSLYAYAIS